jgi:hypothetical protein
MPDVSSWHLPLLYELPLLGLRQKAPDLHEQKDHREGYKYTKNIKFKYFMKFINII